MIALNLSGLSAEDRIQVAAACLDHLAEGRRVDDARAGIEGFGSGAGPAVTLTAVDLARVAVAAAYGGRRLGPQAESESARRIKAVLRPGDRRGVVPPHLDILERALCAAGVDCDFEDGPGDRDRPDLVDLFASVQADPALDVAPAEDRTVDRFSGQTTGVSHLL